MHHDDDDMPSARWQRLALGQCSATEEAELRTQDPERYTLYKPMTQDERERMFDNITRRIGEDRAADDMRALLRVAIALNVGIVAGRWIEWLSPFDSVRDGIVRSVYQVGLTLALASLVMFALHRRFW